MKLGLETPDYIIFLIYFVIVASYGYWVYTHKGKQTADSKDFFLAEGSLTWWAIGSSIIASNISAETCSSVSITTEMSKRSLLRASSRGAEGDRFGRTP